MADDQNFDFTNEQCFFTLLQSVAELQSSACDIGIERQAKQSSLFQEEHDRSIIDINEEETVKIIKQTTDIGRHSMNLMVRGLQVCASYATRKSKYFNTLSSAISYLREQEGSYKPPKHLLLEWEKNVTLIDLFTNEEGLYCNKRMAQDMFDICMETFDWLRSAAHNNK